MSSSPTADLKVELDMAIWFGVRDLVAEMQDQARVQEADQAERLDELRQGAST